MFAPSVLFLALAGSISLSSAFADEGKDESGKGKERGKQEQRENGDGNSRSSKERESQRGDDYFSRNNHSRIPNGHLPPPGECRLWYPDRLAGQQPPPYKCGSRAPAGAWVLQRTAGAPQHVKAVVYDERRPGVVVDVGIFDSRTGSFIKVQGSPR